MNYLIKDLKLFGIFVINILTWLVSSIIPKKKNLIIVGGWFGDRFADNSKFFYLQNFFDSNYKFEMYWITNNREVYDLLKNNELPVLMKWSLKSIYVHLRAKYHVVDQSHRGLAGFLSVRATRINLWHGIGLKRCYFLDRNIERKKKLGFAEKAFSFAKMNLRGWCSPGRWDVQKLVSPTEFDYKMLLSKCFHKEYTTPIYCQYPRVTYMREMREGKKDYNVVSKSEKDELMKLEKMKDDGKRLIFYIPTFREGETYLMGAKNLKELNSFNGWLRENNFAIVFKGHSSDKTSFDGISDWVELDSGMDLTTFIKYADILITDYSSVYSDYLVFDRPEIFYVYDKNEYEKKDRGFLIDYDKNTPGEKIESIDALKKYLDKIIKNHVEDGFEERRADMLEKMHGSNGGCLLEIIKNNKL